MTAIRFPGSQQQLVLGTTLAAAASASLVAVAAVALNEPRIAVGLIAMALAVLVTRLRETTVIKVLIVMLAVQGFPAYFTGYFPAGTLFADDAVAFVLVVVWVMRTIAAGGSVRTIGAAGGCLLILGVYMAASMALHRQTPWESQLFAAWQVAYLWPVGFIAATSIRSVEDVCGLLLFLWHLAWLQVAVVALQWPVLYIAGHFTKVPPVDWFAGTLGIGAVHMLGIWIGMMILLAVALWVHGAITRRQAVPAVCGFLFVLISGSTRQMYVVLPVAIAIVLALSPLRVRARAVLIVAVPLALLGFFRIYSMATQMAFDLDRLVLRTQQNTRLAFYTYSWQLARERDAIWLGQGPGSYASTAGLRFGVPEAKKVSLAFPHDVNMVSATQWPVLLVEIGAVGIGLVLLVFGVLVWRMLLIARWSRWPLARGLALGGTGAVLALLGSGFASRPLEYQLPSLHVWLICGLAAALYAIERESSTLAQPLES